MTVVAVLVVLFLAWDGLGEISIFGDTMVENAAPSVK